MENKKPQVLVCWHWARKKYSLKNILVLQVLENDF